MNSKIQENKVRKTIYLKEENYEKLRSISFFSKKNQSKILDELLEGV